MLKSEFQCPVCGDERKNRKLLQRHLQWHERSKVALMKDDAIISVVSATLTAGDVVSSVSETFPESCLPVVYGTRSSADADGFQLFRTTAAKAVLKLKHAHQSDLTHLSTSTAELVNALSQSSTGLSERELTLMVVTAKFFAGTEKPRKRVAVESILHHLDDVPLVGPAMEPHRRILLPMVSLMCPAAPARPRSSARRRTGASASRKLFFADVEDLALATTPEPPSSPDSPSNVSDKAFISQHQLLSMKRKLPVGCRIVRRRVSKISTLFESPSPDPSASTSVVDSSSATFIADQSSSTSVVDSSSVTFIADQSSSTSVVDSFSAAFIAVPSSSISVEGSSSPMSGEVMVITSNPDDEFQFPDFDFFEREL